ncbi:MAG: ubiquinol-cytochrome c reductase iron-sulfur subunit [Alphaproteobacteria bacterium]
MTSENPDRRKFLYLMAGAMGVFAAGGAAWVLIDSMNPAADTLAEASWADLRDIKPGERVTVAWHGLPVFICRRTEAEIKEIRAEDWNKLRYPQSDESRVRKGHDEWLVVFGVCTWWHGCVLKGNKPNEPAGRWDGWQCPCCGSSYDRSGRVRNGPATKNLIVPNYVFFSDKLIQYQPSWSPMSARQTTD